MKMCVMLLMTRQMNTTIHCSQFHCTLLYTVQGFREKNRDLMRQDIVDLLKTSRMDIVRALIGLPSLASSKWRCLKLMVLAAHAFQQCGKELANRKIGNEVLLCVYVCG